jgi:hypothetical protein
MTRTKWVLLFSALALPMLMNACATSGTAPAAKPVDPAKLAKVECADLTFSKTFLDKYPDAPAACREARVHNGKRYAKFEAEVYISDPEFMTVNLLNAAGKRVTTFSFKPGPTQMIKINGKDTKFHDLRVGEKITFWVSEDRMTASELPGSTEGSWAVLPPLAPKP